jgi:hypothetical protein
MIFGSTAIKHFYPDFREPKDLDVMTPVPLMTREEEHYWSPVFQELIDASTNKEFLDPDLLLTLKASHAGWNIHWQKTMCDILFLKKKGHQINKPLYKKLCKEWTKIHGKKSAPLKGRSAEEFFDDFVDRKYVHDDIHEAVAYYDKPLYTRILKSEDSVDCSEDKFNELSLEDRVKLAKEEIFVTALERWIIPNERYSAGKAYQQSLKKFVTTMSSGWMTFFLVDNFELLCHNTDDYVKKFKEKENEIRTA